MMRAADGCWAVAKVGLAAGFHLLGWPCVVAVLAVAAAVHGYRLLAERTRRRTVLELVTQAPAGTVVMMDGGPGGPALWVGVGDGGSCLTPKVWHGR
jgi:hypothetical protein